MSIQLTPLPKSRRGWKPRCYIPPTLLLPTLRVGQHRFASSPPSSDLYKPYSDKDQRIEEDLFLVELRVKRKLKWKEVQLGFLQRYKRAYNSSTLQMRLVRIQKRPGDSHKSGTSQNIDSV
ncbi:uncharacterized protein BDZ99DRAFT_555643 [Mytilinidion resinicola]|uniref:Uncharacterized protein n=1 Tax=Mytilinidion resinicola TaxID=574789 RepID=A0A6A6YVM8_9PEZI|nr:uncharacterized protein BDZ99DRAFT_555643 [Mytilinidion resinicola]KAF2812820.1 hypothetical protein BDZ99DRAFT_555643 [Mytilinidion resinicola]